MPAVRLGGGRRVRPAAPAAAKEGRGVRLGVATLSPRPPRVRGRLAALFSRRWRGGGSSRCRSAGSTTSPSPPTAPPHFGQTDTHAHAHAHARTHARMHAHTQHTHTHTTHTQPERSQKQVEAGGKGGRQPGGFKTRQRLAPRALSAPPTRPCRRRLVVGRRQDEPARPRHRGEPGTTEEGRGALGAARGRRGGGEQPQPRRHRRGRRLQLGVRPRAVPRPRRGRVQPVAAKEDRGVGGRNRGGAGGSRVPVPRVLKRRGPAAVPRGPRAAGEYDLPPLTLAGPQAGACRMCHVCGPARRFSQSLVTVVSPTTNQSPLSAPSSVPRRTRGGTHHN